MRFSLLAVLLLSSALGAQTPTPGIIAIGTGSVTLRPDRATVMVSVNTKATSPAEAARDNAARMAPLLAALRALDIADSSLSTTGFSVSVEGLYGRPAGDTATRYVASNAIQIALTSLDRIATILDTALAAGASSVSGIRYTSSHATAAHEEAIAAAVRAARADAEAAARAAGGELGDLLSLTMDPVAINEARVRMRYAARDYSGIGVQGGLASSPTSIIFPSTVTESAQVLVRYAFRPRRDR